MTTPKPVKMVAIIAVDEQRRAVRFITTDDVLQTIRDRQYGRINVISPDAGEYELQISPLYAHEDVVDWLQELAA